MEIASGTASALGECVTITGFLPNLVGSRKGWQMWRKGESAGVMATPFISQALDLLTCLSRAPPEYNLTLAFGP
jgi:hypothetical protein